MNTLTEYASAAVRQDALVTFLLCHGERANGPVAGLSGLLTRGSGLQSRCRGVLAVCRGVSPEVKPV